MTLQSSITSLKAASIFTIGTGLVFFFALFTSADFLAGLLFDIAIWPLDGAQDLNTSETRLLLAISGGMLVGWGIMFWLVATLIYAENPQIGGKVILYSILSWFIIDSTGSIIAGFGANAVMNLVFLAIFALPVLMHASSMKKQTV